jgi:hypothetical protein
VWDVSPYALYEYGALPSRHKPPRLLTYDIRLFYRFYRYLPGLLGTITWHLFALFTPLLMSPKCSICPGPELACIATVPFSAFPLVTQKMDLGACPKSHTERLKTEFLAAKAATPNDPTFARFQKEYESNIFQFVDECDRRIRAAHRRLEKTPEENAKTTNLVSGGVRADMNWDVKIGDGLH